MYHDDKRNVGWQSSVYETAIGIDDYVEVYNPTNNRAESDFLDAKREKIDDSRFEGLVDREEGMNQYEKGFNDAQKFVLKEFDKNHFVKFQLSCEYNRTDNYWYNLGYKDGYNYYSQLVNENEIYEKRDDEEILKDSYSKRLYKEKR